MIFLFLQFVKSIFIKTVYREILEYMYIKYVLDIVRIFEHICICT